MIFSFSELATGLCKNSAFLFRLRMAGTDFPEEDAEVLDTTTEVEEEAPMDPTADVPIPPKEAELDVGLLEESDRARGRRELIFKQATWDRAKKNQ